jgi:hypothetical protein
MSARIVIMAPDFLDRAETLCASLVTCERRHENPDGARVALDTLRKVRALRARLEPAPEYGPEGWRLT